MNLFACALLVALQGFEERKLATLPSGFEARNFAFSADGKILAYVKDKGLESRVVVGDWESETLGSVVGLHLTPDGKYAGFMARKDGRYFIFVNDRAVAGGDDDWWVAWGGALSSDGAHVAHPMSNQKKGLYKLIVDGKQVGELTSEARWPAMSADGLTVAYSVQGGDKEYVVVGGKKGSEFDYVSQPILSADGKVAAYAVEDNDRKMLVRGDEKSPIPSWPWGVFLSPDGRAAGCILRRLEGETNHYSVWVDGTRGEEFASIPYRPVFSPDRKTVAYAATSGEKTYAVIGDRKSTVPSCLNAPAWSPDGKSVGYGAKVGNEVWWKALPYP